MPALGTHSLYLRLEISGLQARPGPKAGYSAQLMRA